MRGKAPKTYLNSLNRRVSGCKIQVMTTGAVRKEWVDWQNAKVLQKAVVVDEEGNILSIRRAPTGPASRPDKFDLPGGSAGPEDLEVANPLEEAIRREVEEETGLDVTSAEPVYVSSWVFTRSPGKILGVAVGYKCTVAGVKPKVSLSAEHYQSLWGTKEKILALDFGEDGGMHKKIIEAARV